MPSDSIFRLCRLNAGEKALEAEIEIIKEHSVLKGHFPGRPVVPGVFLIGIIRDILAGHVQRELRLRRGDNIKFTAPLEPEKEALANVSIRFTAGESGILAEASIGASNKTFILFKGEFAFTIC